MMMRFPGRRFLLIAGVSTTALAPITRTAPAQSAPLIGAWEALTRSAGGLGVTIAFDADRTLRYTLGAMVDMKYRRSRDSLYIVDPQGPVNPFKISFARDTLVMLNEGKEQRETRVSAALAGGDPIVGTWTYMHYTGVPAFEEFTAAGDFHLRVPIRTLEGKWTSAGDSAMLHLPGPGGGDRAVHFAVVADTLLLVFGGQTSRYVRINSSR